MVLLHGVMASQGLFTLQLSDPVTQKALISLAALIIIYGLFFVIAQILNRAIKDLRLRHKIRKFFYYLAAVLLVLVLIFIWSDFAGQFAIVLSVIGAGLAIALQQPLISLAAWLYIIINRPYTIGDRIELGGVAGDIIDIRVFKTVLLEIASPGASLAAQSTGRVVDLPNGLIFSQTLYNYTRGFEYLWNEYAVVVTLESDWERALEVLSKIIQRHTEQFEVDARSQIERMAEQYMIEYGVLSAMIYVSIQSSGVELVMRYLSPVRQTRQIRDAISRDVLTALEKEPNVELAYPTTRAFKRSEEEPKLQMKQQTRKAGREE